ncbi:response regulator [Paracoccus sp. M683]|uniref:sensor histidine kinase n=1 Tax=Paracoccus sp. M683 TaxID=2594268 RepID=UPI00117BDFBA|nr:response regulator [Paracoccus sp. M683]TRW95217.1 response regulator [Paracoccus sp. M683]
MNRRLLIIDDDADFAVATSRALALENLDCRIAPDGATAFALLEAEPVQVALLDIRLGQEDGVEIAARLLARHPGLILVIMTAYASVDSAIAALKAGAYDYLRKPFFLDQLMRALERCFQLVELRAAKARAERQLALLHRIEVTSQLAAGLSHDFKNMLAVIQANVTVIEDGLPIGDGLFPYARDARKAVQSADGLVQRLMGFARNGSAPAAPVDLRDPIRAAVSLLGGTLCAGMTIRCDLPDHPLRSPVAPEQIQTALVNLLINARDATGGQGRVDIVLQHLSQGSDYARLVVEDDGPGFSAATLERVMEPLFTTKPEGTGLGLAMIQHLALVTGGSFGVGNGVMGGARAVLDLPCLGQDQLSGANM